MCLIDSKGPYAITDNLVRDFEKCKEQMMGYARRYIKVVRSLQNLSGTTIKLSL